MKGVKCFIFLLMISGLFSCRKGGCLDSAGATISSTRAAAPFTKIELYDNINLVLTQDTVEKIVVEGGKNIIANISTDIAQNVLTIRNNTACPWLRQPGEIINVHISVKKLEEILYNGSGNITATNTLTSDRLFIYSYEGAGNINVAMQANVGGVYIHHENADVTLRGTCQKFFSYTNARGSIDFRNLQVADMVIEYGGVRPATINVTENLDAIIYHTGHLYYKGNPKIKLQTHSTGELLRLP